MKFMVQWSIDQDKWIPILELWASMSPEERGDAGDGVKIIGRWHDTAGRGGVAIFEADSLPALNIYLGNWNPHMEMEVTPVLDDDESAAVAQTIAANAAANA